MRVIPIRKAAMTNVVETRVTNIFNLLKAGAAVPSQSVRRLLTNINMRALVTAADMRSARTNSHVFSNTLKQT